MRIVEWKDGDGIQLLKVIRKSIKKTNKKESGKHFLKLYEYIKHKYKIKNISNMKLITSLRK